MLASNLNRYISLHDDSETVDSAGGSVKNYTEIKKTYASVKQIGGTSKYKDIGEISDWMVEFIIRYDSRVNYGTRIVYNNENYKIHNLELIGRNEGWKITAIVFKEYG